MASETLWLKKKNILIAIFALQVVTLSLGLLMFGDSALTLEVSLLLIFTSFHLLVFYISTLKSKEAKLSQGYFKSLVLSTILQSVLLVLVKKEDFLLLKLGQVFLLATNISICLNIFKQNKSTEKNLIILTAALALAYILKILVFKSSNSELFFAFLIIAISAYPLYYIYKMRKESKPYKFHLKDHIFYLGLLTLSFILFIPIIIYIDRLLYNIIFLIHCNLILLIVDITIFPAIKGYFGYVDLFFSLLILIFLRNELEFFSFFIIFMSMYKFTYIEIKEYKKIKDIIAGKERRSIEDNIYAYKFKENAEKNLALYLHNSSVQDLLALKNNIIYDEGFDKQDTITSIDKILKDLRFKIHAYKPVISKEIELAENYKRIYKNIRKNYESSNVFLEFTCEEDIYLPWPYDKIVYIILMEVINNTYKHSKGNYSKLDIHIFGNEICIEAMNYGDYFEYRGKTSGSYSGLDEVKSLVEDFGGEFSIENEKEEGEDLVQILISIPIERSLTYEYFTNR